MSQDHIELRGSSAAELRLMDRILFELSRPTLDDESVPSSTRAAMLEVGIGVSGRASRNDLIERVWGRRRSVLCPGGRRRRLAAVAAGGVIVASPAYKSAGPRSLDE